MQVVELDISLLDMPYPVTRRLRVPVAIRLADLDKLLQAAMPWDNSHLHDFTLGRSLRWIPEARESRDGTRDSRKDRLGDVLAQMGRTRAFTYTYDMGDNWEHEIRPGKPRELAEGEPPIDLLAAEGACAPEDSGGAPGFDHLLRATADPAHEANAEMVEWLGDSHPWNPVADRQMLASRVRALAARILKRM